MKARVVSLVLVAVTTVAIGCNSAAEDDTEGADAALSEADCTPKAEAEQKKALAACEKANAFDFPACVKPAETRFEKWKADLAAAHAEVKDQIASITGQCHQDVEALDCKAILGQAKKDFAAAAGDAKACAAERATRAAACDTGAKDAIEGALGSNSKYMTLAEAGPTERAAYDSALIGCWGQRALNGIGGATCSSRAKLAYQSAYLSCRRECPNIAGTACTPDDYKGKDVQCGTFSTKSSGLGLFCESGKECKRTTVCNKYDDAKKEADSLTKSAGCTASDGSPGVIIVKVTISKDKNGDVPKGVTTVCEKAPATTTK